MIRWFDSHIHLDDSKKLPESFDAKQLPMKKALIAGTSPINSEAVVTTCEQHNLLYSLGLHPWFIDGDVSELLDDLRRDLRRYQPNALGECGLDKVRGASWEIQEVAFEAQLILAQEFNLPVVIHSVRAHHHVLSTLKKIDVPKKGVIHGFNGNMQQAMAFVDLGYKIGIGTFVCRETSKKLRDVAQKLPLEAMLLETDKSLDSFSEKKSLSVEDVAQTIASLRQETLEEIARVTFSNSEVLFSK